MQVIENLKVKEKLYTEKLSNGLTVMIIPKHGILKKYIIWGTNYGSNDSTFIVLGEEKETVVPEGVAHFLEHKMFEQENGVNSLDTLTALGVEANAYTTNDHTAYLYECTDIFYEALKALGTPKEKTWVFEDSLTAIKTANKTGLNTVGIYDEFNFCHDEIKKVATKYIAENETMEKLINEV